jgi:uncharacterized protein YndB with AHSA1/START domain
MMQNDVTTYIDAVERSVWTEDRDGQPVRVAKAVRWYPTTIEDLWDALTNAERLPRWFLPVSGDLRLGGHYQLEGNAGGTITECHPPRRLGLTWEFGGAVTWVSVDLDDDGQRSRLQLEHRASVDDDTWRQFGPGAVGIGWDLGLLGLALHIETSAAVDPAEVAVWSASDDGRAFMKGTGDGWCQASIAGGTPAAEAEEAAERTFVAYTAAPDAGESPPDEPST